MTGSPCRGAGDDAGIGALVGMECSNACFGLYRATVIQRGASGQFFLGPLTRRQPRLHLSGTSQ